MDSGAFSHVKIGEPFGEKYRIVRPLGSGGMGAVFEAENTWTLRKVALKVMRAELSQREDAAERFLREAQSAARVAHPNIVDVLDMGRDPASGSLYIVQELLQGVDLRTRLEQAGGRLGVDEALDIVVPVMGALVAAELRGIVHRDIKPENIFLMRAKSGAVVPKLIDFGVSKILDVPLSSAARTRSGMPLGTPDYMSPEQARGDIEVDGRTDVWAIGVVLYESLSGACPYDDETPNLVLVKILSDPVPPLEERAPWLSRSLVEVIHRALARDREQRYPTMRAFLAALLECDREEVAHSSPPRPSLATRHSESIPSLEAVVDNRDTPRELAYAAPEDATATGPDELSDTTVEPRRAHARPSTFSEGPAAPLGAAAVATPDRPTHPLAPPQPDGATPLTAVARVIAPEPAAPSRRAGQSVALWAAAGVVGVLLAGGVSWYALRPHPIAGHAPATRERDPIPAPPTTPVVLVPAPPPLSAPVNGQARAGDSAVAPADRAAPANRGTPTARTSERPPARGNTVPGAGTGVRTREPTAREPATPSTTPPTPRDLLTPTVGDYPGVR